MTSKQKRSAACPKVSSSPRALKGVVTAKNRLTERPMAVTPKPGSNNKRVLRGVFNLLSRPVTADPTGSSMIPRTRSQVLYLQHLDHPDSWLPLFYDQKVYHVFLDARGMNEADTVNRASELRRMLAPIGWLIEPVVVGHSGDLGRNAARRLQEQLIAPTTLSFEQYCAIHERQGVYTGKIPGGTTGRVR